MKSDNKAPKKSPDSSDDDQGFFSSLYNFFNSIRLTVFLFIILGLASIAGTIIEQGADPAKYAQEYSETTIKFFNAFGLFDMYHTPWFLVILLLLILNLIVCTIERLPKVHKFLKRIKPILEEGDEKKYPFMEELSISSNPVEKVETVLGPHGRINIWVILLDIACVAFAIFLVRTYTLNVLEFISFIVIPLIYIVLINFQSKMVRTEKDGTVHFFVHQWPLSRYGVYITHVSILIIFIGAIMGSLFGFKGYVGITEGETTNRIFLRQDKLMNSVSASVTSFFSDSPKRGPMIDPYSKREIMTFPFSIRCDDFSISYYENTGRPKDYTSDLVVIRDEQEVEKKTIEVNDPLIVDKIYFYQSNYGPSRRPGLVVLEITPPGGNTQEYRTPVNGSFRIEGTETDLHVQSYIPDFTIVNGNVRQRSEDMINPALFISAKQGQKGLFNGWVFPNYPEHSAKTGNYQVRFKDYWGTQYTGLQVAYDPGVEIVWIGCMLLVAGLMISFFHSHQRIWARVQGNNVVIAGSAHKNRMAFEQKFNTLIHLLKE